MSAIPDSSLPGHKHLHERVVSALDLCQEARDIEFKSSACWNDLRIHIVKTCMAMSNLRDGGVVVVGVREEGTGWIFAGILGEDLATYNEDNVNDAVNRFASPPLRVELVLVSHADAQFLAIRVPEFSDRPTVCKKDGAPQTGLVCGAVFVRPPGKPQTTPLRSAEDMRDLMELAAEKRARALLQAAHRIGMHAPPPADRAYDEELGGL